VCSYLVAGEAMGIFAASDGATGVQISRNGIDSSESID
jgi:hypothetical protein